MHNQNPGNPNPVRNLYLRFLVALQFLKCLLRLRASLLNSLGLFDQHIALAGLDVDSSLLLVDLRFPRLKLLLLLLNLDMKYLRLV
jgi:hypothetical protein